MGYEQKEIEFKGKLNRFRNVHRDQSVIVCGLGSSFKNKIEEIKQSNHKIIGVNYIGKWLVPHYCIIVDRLYPNMGEAWNDMVTNNKSLYTFTHYLYPGRKTEWINTDFIHYRKGGIKKILSRNQLFGCWTSTISAIALALFMGFRNIGVIGLDLKNHWKLENYVDEIDKCCYSILMYCREQGIEILNLSKKSLIRSFPKCTLKQFNEWYGDNND